MDISYLLKNFFLIQHRGHKPAYDLDVELRKSKMIVLTI